MSHPLPANVEPPRELYHASAQADIKEFKPQQRGYRDKSEGSVIFGAIDKAHAACFLVKTDDRWASIGYLNDVPYMLISDETRYRQKDHGGVIYTLPAETFDYDPDKGTGWREWTSQVAVRPTKQESYPSAIEAMLDLGVQVYFCDPPTLQSFKAAAGRGKFDIITALKSENQKQNRNVVLIR